jgi:hypothetical protein
MRRSEREQQRLLAGLDEERRGDLGFVLELPGRARSASSKQRFALGGGADGPGEDEELRLQGCGRGPSGLAPQLLLVLATDEDPAIHR